MPRVKRGLGVFLLVISVFCLNACETDPNLEAAELTVRNRTIYSLKVKAYLLGSDDDVQEKSISAGQSRTFLLDRYSNLVNPQISWTAERFTNGEWVNVDSGIASGDKSTVTID